MSSKSSGNSVVCPYCGLPCELKVSEEIWGHGGDRLVWRCAPCDAHVGCHPKTTKPLGTPAKLALRKRRIRAHSVFDPIWRSRYSKHMKRAEAYAFLAAILGVENGSDKAHIGALNEDECEVVTQAMRRYFLGEEVAGRVCPKDKQVRVD